MNYINNVTGTSQGPLQIQKEGPWLSSGKNKIEGISDAYPFIITLPSPVLLNSENLNYAIDLSKEGFYSIKVSGEENQLFKISITGGEFITTKNKTVKENNELNFLCSDLNKGENIISTNGAELVFQVKKEEKNSDSVHIVFSITEGKLILSSSDKISVFYKYLKISQFPVKKEDEDPGIDGDKIYLKMRTPDFNDPHDAFMIPNVRWIQSYVNHVLSGGDPVDLADYVSVSDFKVLKTEVNVLKNNVSRINTDLTETKKSVKILIDWKTEVDQPLWILDGGRPGGGHHFEPTI